VSHPKLAIVALGSNLGDCAGNILAAFARLERLTRGSLLKSSLWESTPVDCPPGSPNFINAAAAFEPLPGETPESLLTKLQSIEKEFGRKSKAVLNEPRPLDLDLISFQDQIRSGQDLTLPHPRAHLRRFVLEPLKELLPQLTLPGESKNVEDLLLELPPDGTTRRR
jgi:2-amino-4-hydroxy-6-hydroxymethyldihydropteridine diphosphokinase